MNVISGGNKLDSVNFRLIGYDTLGKNEEEGVRYAWKHHSSDCLVESAAFSQRSKTSSDNVCAYTTSVSSGCILNSMGLACKFCRTGTQLPFGGLLKASEIAKQNVFMVLTDMHCSDHLNLRSNQREFAYMGQGEPGFSYKQIKEAINLTNIAMKELGQTVFRHIIATSGVSQMIKSYVEDLKTGIFTSRTTMHFSLHGTSKRSVIMPIETKFPYLDSLTVLSDIRSVAGEKPCIGILLFKNFIPANTNTVYSTDFNCVEKILHELDSSKFRLSFCEFNGSPDLGTFEPYDSQTRDQILLYAKKLGFEAKIFSSFGKNEITACGMLGGKKPSKLPSQKWIDLEHQAENIITVIRNITNN